MMMLVYQGNWGIPVTKAILQHPFASKRNFAPRSPKLCKRTGFVACRFGFEEVLFIVLSLEVS